MASRHYSGAEPQGELLVLDDLGRFMALFMGCVLILSAVVLACVPVEAGDGVAHGVKAVICVLMGLGGVRLVRRSR